MAVIYDIIWSNQYLHLTPKSWNIDKDKEKEL